MWIHCKPIPVMKKGLSLCSFSHREKPVFITWEPCVEKLHRENPVLALYWPCTGLQCTAELRFCRIMIMQNVDHA